jgi:hypothetical protein
MTNPTIRKLENICKKHGVEVDASKDWDGWLVTFYAPDFHIWGSSTATVSVYHDDTLRGVISFLRSELSCGFYKLDPTNPDDLETLGITGQLANQREN